MGPARFLELGVEDDAQIANKESKRAMQGWMFKYEIAPKERVWRALGNFERWIVSLAATDCALHAETLGIPWYNEFIVKYKVKSNAKSNAKPNDDPLRNFADRQLVQFKPDNVLLHVVWMRAVVLRLEERGWCGSYCATVSPDHFTRSMSSYLASALEPDLFSQNLPSCVVAALQKRFEFDNRDAPTTLEETLFMHARHASRMLQDIVVQVDRARRKRYRDQAQMATIQRVEPQAQPQAPPQVQPQHEVQHEAAGAIPFSVAAANAAREAKRMRAAEAAEVDEWADTECPSP